ncbi:hypothetical protein NQ317_016530, partial [Molorchus minor]
MGHNRSDSFKLTENCTLALNSSTFQDLIISVNFSAVGDSEENISSQCCSTEVISCYYTQFNFSSSDISAFFQYQSIEDNIKASKGFNPIQLSSANNVSILTICFPTSCTNEDIAKVVKGLNGSEIKKCRKEDDSGTTANFRTIFASVILTWFVLLVTLSTTYDLYCQKHELEPVNECFIAFSVHKNGNRIFSITKRSSEMLCLNGIRVLSMFWVIVLHTFSEICSARFAETEVLKNWENSIGSMVVRSGTLAVDSFLVVGGTLLSYNFMTKRTKVFSIWRYYLHRYIRLTPPLAAAILVSSTLLGDIESTIIKNKISKPCQKYWWSSLLYVQNYVNPQDLCLSQTWYLSTDMQLYLISPLILIPLWKFPRAGVIPLVILVPLSILIPFYITYQKRVVADVGIIPYKEN